MQYDPRSLLVIDLAPFGKALLSLPAMQALRQAFPQTRILTAATKGLSELLKEFQLADEVVDLGIIKPQDQGFGSAILRLFRLLGTAKGEGFDLVIDFAPRLETQIVSKLGWRTRHLTPSRIGHFLDLFLKRGVGPVDDHAEDCAITLKKVGIPAIPKRFTFQLMGEASHRFEDLLQRRGSPGGEPIVVFYSAQARDAHRWGEERFSEIAFRLVNNFQARIVVLDEPQASDFTRAMKNLLPKGTISMASPRAVDFLAALARASLVITDERGVAKTASDLDAPVIELADTFSPFGDLQSYRLIQSSSFNRISIEAVFEAASELIQEGRTLSLFRR